MKYNTIVVTGAQFGDEGKGKVVDYIAQDAHYVVRHGGGGNAGHTIKVGDTTYKLHLIPSGILNKKTVCVLGNGVVLDIPALVDEINNLRKIGISITGDNLKISDNANLILDCHKKADGSEHSDKIGTTKKGIGPAYSDKMNRTNLRVADLFRPQKLVDKIKKNDTFQEELERQLIAFEEIIDMVCDTQHIVQSAVYSGLKTIFEGAQGTYLDIDHGYMPFVTSSSCCAGGACTGSGIGPTTIKEVIGVAKAYTTRVGNGPFVTELTNDIGEKLCEIGKEFGTTTGRKRRCGWLDLVMLKRAVRLNGMTGLAITKLDVLDTFEIIEVATNYPWNNNPIATQKPIYKSFKGWQQPTTHIRRYEFLPTLAREFLEFIENETSTPIKLISVGASRDATIVKDY